MQLPPASTSSSSALGGAPSSSTCAVTISHGRPSRPSSSALVANFGQRATRAEPRLYAWLRDALSHGYMPGCATLTTRAEPRLHAWLRKAPNSMAHATTARPCQRTHPDVRPCPAGTVFTRLKLSCIAAPPPGGGGDQTGTTSRPPIALYRGLAGTEAHSNGRTRVTPSRDATSQHLSGASTLALLQPPPLACSRVPDSTRVIANMRHRVELTGGGASRFEPLQTGRGSWGGRMADRSPSASLTGVTHSNRSDPG